MNVLARIRARAAARLYRYPRLRPLARIVTPPGVLIAGSITAGMLTATAVLSTRIVAGSLTTGDVVGTPRPPA